MKRDLHMANLLGVPSWQFLHRPACDNMQPPGQQPPPGTGRSDWWGSSMKGMDSAGSAVAISAGSVQPFPASHTLSHPLILGLLCIGIRTLEN